MNSHTLGLEVLNTSNESIFKITDISVYSTILPVACPELLITAPGFQYSASIDATLLVEGFSLVLTACNLEIQTLQCDSVMNLLPDGIYSVRYSISPNELVFVEYNHLRVTAALNRLDKILCQLDISECLLDKDKKERLDKIMEVKSYLEAAKVKVEMCHESKKGMKIYNYALKMLDKLDCKYCG